MNIDKILYLDDFRFVVFTTQAIYLHDLRYSQIPISEFPLSINYKGLDIKQVKRSYFEDIHLTALDKTGKDNSHLLISVKEEKDLELFNTFTNTRLIKNNKFMQDVSGVRSEDELYMYFSVDQFGGLDVNVYNLLNVNNPTKSYFCMMNDTFLNDNLDDKNKTIYDTIQKLTEESYNRKIYKKEKKKQKLKFKSEEEMSDENPNLDSDSSEEIDYGYAKVNGEKTKLFDVCNKRKLMEKVFEKFGEMELEEDDNSGLRSNTHVELNEVLKPIIDKFSI